MSDSLIPARSRAWTRTLCGVLLAATLLNYANRFAFTQNALPIQDAFQTDDDGYGHVAGRFALGFACGGLLFGFLADRISVRVLYPTVVVVWSLAGMSSGMVESLFGLGISRFVLGLFEAGHWPCALRTTQRAFHPAMRTLGNSILQSGASVGAVLTPLLVLALHEWNPERWRWAFYVVGGFGLPWALAWLLLVRERDVRRPVIQTDEAGDGPGEPRELEEIPFWQVFTTRRWWLLLVVVCLINTVWHFIRVWMPVWLEDDLHYPHEFVQMFTSVYFLTTFFGSLASGWMTAALPRRGWNVHRARLAAFLLFALMSALVVPAAFMPPGRALLGTLLVVAFGTLGLFPIYYSLTQEISAKNQGKVSGTLSFATWGTLYFFHGWVGNLTAAHPELRPWIFTCVGCGPLLGFFVLFFCWGRRPAEGERRTSG